MGSWIGVFDNKVYCHDWLWHEYGHFGYLIMGCASILAKCFQGWLMTNWEIQSSTLIIMHAFWTNL